MKGYKTLRVPPRGCRHDWMEPRLVGGSLGETHYESACRRCGAVKHEVKVGDYPRTLDPARTRYSTGRAIAELEALRRKNRDA